MLFLDPEILLVLVILSQSSQTFCIAPEPWDIRPISWPRHTLYSLGPANLSVTVFFPEQLTSFGDVAPILTEALHRT